MRNKRIFTLAGAAIVVIGAIAGVAYAQGMGMGMGHNGMMSMATMMDRIQGVIGETSQMMDHARSQGMMGQGTMHGQSGTMHGQSGTMHGRSGTMSHNHAMMPGSEEMMGMVQGTDSMAHTMNGLMQNMQNMMGNQKLMEKPAYAEHLQTMQRSMSTMMKGFDGFVNDVKALQEQQSSN